MSSHNSRYTVLHFLIAHKNSSSSNQLNGNTNWWQNFHVIFPIAEVTPYLFRVTQKSRITYATTDILITYGVIHNALMAIPIHSTIQFHYWPRFDIVSAICKRLSGIEIWIRIKMDNVQTKTKIKQFDRSEGEPYSIFTFIFVNLLYVYRIPVFVGHSKGYETAWPKSGVKRSDCRICKWAVGTFGVWHFNPRFI